MILFKAHDTSVHLDNRFKYMYSKQFCCCIVTFGALKAAFTTKGDAFDGFRQFAIQLWI